MKWGGFLALFASIGLAVVLRKWLIRLCEVRRKKKVIRWTSEEYAGHVTAEALKVQKVPFIFTLTGGHIAPILVGCKKAGIRVVDVRHEATAVFAADAVSRLSGVPGVAVVTAGPGVTNTITAVKNAQMAESAVIVIGGATTDVLKGKGSLQDIDQFALFRPHVKGMFHIQRVSDVVPMIERAFRLAQSGVPGPVFVEYPLDVLYPEPTTRQFYASQMPRGRGLVPAAIRWYLSRHVSKMFDSRRIEIFEPLPVTRPQSPDRWIHRTIRVLESSRKPVLLIGSQAMVRPSHVKGMIAAINALGLPCFLMSMARGLLGRDHPLHIRHHRTDALRESDCVILLGVAMDFRLDYGFKINAKATLVSVNLNKRTLWKNRTPQLAVHGDPCDFLCGLSAELTADRNFATLADIWADWQSTLQGRDALREEAIATTAEQSTEYLNPVWLCKQADAVLDDRSIIIGDGGDFVGTAAYTVKPRAELSWLDPGVFGTLGVGAGFALGAKLVRPDDEVWVFFGDGACGYSLTEFDTFVRHGINIIALVGNDACWMQMYRGQMEIFNDDVACALEYTRYHDVIEGFGAVGMLVDNEEDVPVTLMAAKEAAKEKPVLVNALIGKTDFRKGSLSM